MVDTPLADSDQASKVLTVEETAKELRISRNGAYEAIRRKEIPSIRIGRRIIVPRVALQRLLDNASGEATA